MNKYNRETVPINTWLLVDVSQPDSETRFIVAAFRPNTNIASEDEPEELIDIWDTGFDAWFTPEGTFWCEISAALDNGEGKKRGKLNRIRRLLSHYRLDYYIKCFNNGGKRLGK